MVRTLPGKRETIIFGKAVRIVLNYDTNKYKAYLTEEFLLNMEKERGVTCLFGAAFGPYVYGIDNRVSDFDFYLIFDKKGRGDDAFRSFDEDSMTDVYMLDINYIQTSSRTYLNGIPKYPSVLYRKSENVHVYNIHREDFTSQIIFEILYSDYVWDSGYLSKNIDSILSEISYIGVLDYYFSRVYGNLKNQLSKEQAPAVKYLMSFLGYSCLKWLLEYRTIPNMDIWSMLRFYAPAWCVDFLTEVIKVQKGLDAKKDYRMHQADVGTYNLFQISPQEADRRHTTLEKKKAVVSRNERYNEWLWKEIETIRAIIEEIGKKGASLTLQKGNASFLFRQ